MIPTIPGQDSSSFVRPIIVWLTYPSLESGEYEHSFSYPESHKMSNLKLDITSTNPQDTFLVCVDRSNGRAQLFESSVESSIRLPETVLVF